MNRSLTLNLLVVFFVGLGLGLTHQSMSKKNNFNDPTEITHEISEKLEAKKDPVSCWDLEVLLSFIDFLMVVPESAEASSFDEIRFAHLHSQHLPLYLHSTLSPPRA